MAASNCESILHTKLQPSGPMHSNETAITEFTYEEENAIMSGYVVRKLQASGKYGFVEFFVIKDPDGADHESTDWIKLIDRGGLV